jgi:serine/threonine-protein kinase
VGKGGMGEVYRADDLTLDLPVALKLLPEELSRDEGRLRRFRHEVKIARQISHPNVCRVHDIGEADGLTFLSMEYIHGEDLRSLLRRIGRVPAEKAVEIARELASGLAAAHERGILHRDLKPANVMIDERGRARITDFGLAAAAGSVESRDVRSGTPAYMSPEQWAGTGVSERSDLYSLGLVLYELFTGRLPFSPPQGLAKDAAPPRPSKLVEGLDPAIERVILRCLETDPRRRPASALAVGAALPGGDPLAAAVARGETPATALVADAWEATSVSPAAAWACLVLVLAALPVHLSMAGQSRLSQIVPLPKSPEVLGADARAILTSLGYPGPQRDRTHGFSRDTAYIDFLMTGPDRDSWKERLARGEPSVVRFWYRESPRPLVPHRTTEFFAALHDPPDDAPGAVNLELDTRGRLRRLEAVPPDADDWTDIAPSPDWGPLLKAAGLDPGALTPVEPRWFPPHYADRRGAWEGVYPDAPEVPFRLEAAAFRGRVVALRVIEPWTQAAGSGGVSHWVRPEEVVPSPWARVAHVGFHIAFMIGLAFLARRNQRLGRGDTRLAFRLASFVLVLVFGQWALGAHHVPDRSEMEVFFGGLYRGFFAFALSWLCYVALEPYVRKLWPRSLISWIRLLNGRFRDPVVGRDVLLGCVFGIGLGLTFQAAAWVPLGPGRAPPRPDRPTFVGELVALGSPSEALAELLAIQVNALTHILLLIGGLLLLRFVLRRTWLALAFHGTLYVLVYASGFPRGYLTLAIWICAWYLMFFRFGWTSLVIGTATVQLLTGYPLTINLSAWYAYATVLVVGFCLALTLYGFKVSLGGRPPFQDLPAIE